jgi:exodeoxyribonuclease-3
MKIATFNINGIKARTQALLDWLAEAQPDVACLQEIKSVDEAFPREAFEALGYRVETHGMKAFNGVAILSKLPLEDVTRRLPGDEADEQARWIEATVIGPKRAVRLCGLYLPNGNPQPGPKFDYKLRWMDRLAARARALLAAEIPTVLAGDYNVIPNDDDTFSTRAMADDALMQPESRQAYRRLVAQGAGVSSIPEIPVPAGDATLTEAAEASQPERSNTNGEREEGSCREDSNGEGSEG